MTPIVVRVPGVMIGKARARVVRNSTYTPEATRHWSAVVKACAMEQAGLPRLTGPLSLLMAVGLPVPQSWSQKRRGAALAGLLMPVAKPDVSNMLKLVEDALNHVLWVDDSQLVSVTVTKRYVEAPATVLTVDRIEHHPIEKSEPSGRTR